MTRTMAGRLTVATVTVVMAVATFASPAFATLTVWAELNTRTITLGETVDVTGEVNIPGESPLVVLQRNVGGVWTDRNTARVQPDGKFAITLRPSQTGLYVLRVRSIGGRVLSHTLKLQVTRAPEIRVVLSATTTSPGSEIVAVGKVDPAEATPRVVLQRRVGTRWLDREGVKVNSATGDFTLTIRPSTAGTYVMRIRSGQGTVVSRTLYVRVIAVAPVLD